MGYKSEKDGHGMPEPRKEKVEGRIVNRRKKKKVQYLRVHLRASKRNQKRQAKKDRGTESNGNKIEAF